MGAGELLESKSVRGLFWGGASLGMSSSVVSLVDGLVPSGADDGAAWKAER